MPQRQNGAAHFHFHRNSGIHPASSFASLCDTHCVGGESLTEPHVEHCIIYATSARSNCQGNGEMETGAITKSNRFAKRITYFETSRKFLWMHVPLLQCMRLILRLRLILDVTPADVETGLSNVICY